MPARSSIVTIPNLITITRLILVPTVVWLIISGDHKAAFWLFVATGVGDAVDGFIARQFQMQSQLGSYLDPIADKLLLVSIYITLAIQLQIPVWLTLTVVSRDVLIVIAVVLSWVLGAPVEMRPLAISKLNTLAQIVLASVVLADLAFALDFVRLREALVIVVAALTVASAGAYLIDWVRIMGRV